MEINSINGPTSTLELNSRSTQNEDTSSQNTEESNKAWSVKISDQAHKLASEMKEKVILEENKVDVNQVPDDLVSDLLIKLQTQNKI